MKIISMFLVLFSVLSCSTKDDWDSGGKSETAFQNEGMSEQDRSIQNQLPPVKAP